MKPLTDYWTLLLDSSWQPIKIIPATKGLILDMKGRVIVAESHDRVIRSQHEEWVLPSVVALKQYIRYARPIQVTYTRRNVFIRDDRTCAYCSKRFHPKHLTIDHVIPRSKGGKDEWLNVVTACEPCNHKKRDRTPQEAGMPLQFMPFRPDRNTLIKYERRIMPRSWMKHLGIPEDSFPEDMDIEDVDIGNADSA